MDKIFIRSLELMAYIGVYPWEQKNKQKLLLDIEINYDVRSAGNSDNLEDSIDYAAVCNMVTDHVESNRFGLIERVAESIAQLILLHFHIPIVRVKVSKPEAIARAIAVCVVVERYLSDALSACCVKK